MLQECFTYNAKRIIVEEIALEGLEGIGLDLLWRRVEYRTNFPVSAKTKCRFWAFILNHKEIALYQLPEPLPHVEVVDRFTIVDEDSGNLKNPVSKDKKRLKRACTCSVQTYQSIGMGMGTLHLLTIFIMSVP